MNRKILIAITVCFIVGIAAGAVAYVYNKPHRNIASEKAAHTLTAEQLYSEYEADEQASNTKYLDKVVVVTGVVENISQNMEGHNVVSLTASNIGGVNCTLKEKQSPEIKTGDNVTLKCRCTGKLMDVVMVDCTVQK